MEKDRSSRGSQNQFSIYSNKGGIIVKEEVSSEKAFTKAVKEICINESTQPLMGRNMSLNFDHSVVDGVIAIELSREPVLKTLDPIESVKDVSGPVKMKKLGVGDDPAVISQATMVEGAITQKPTETNLTSDATTVKQENSTTVENAIDRSKNTTDVYPKDSKLADADRSTKSKDPDEVTAGTGTDIGRETGTGEKPVSPSKEKAQNQVSSPINNSVGNNGDSGHSGSIAVSVPSTPTSPIPHSDNISNRSDSTNTSNRSFAFPVLPREWTSSPVKMEISAKSHSRKSRGCSIFFCCN